MHSEEREHRNECARLGQSEQQELEVADQEERDGDESCCATPPPRRLAGRRRRTLRPRVDPASELDDPVADRRVLLSVGRQQTQCGLPVAPCADGIARAGRGVGLGRKLFQRAGMNERRAGGTRQRIGWQFGTAGCAVCRRQAGVETGAAPTRYGPRISSLGAPVILQACLIPMKMMNALMRPDGNDPTTTSTGRAAIKASRNAKLRRTLTPPGFVVGARRRSGAAAAWL